MKVAGDMGKFLQLLPITQSRDYLDLQAHIRSRHRILSGHAGNR